MIYRVILSYPIIACIILADIFGSLMLNGYINELSLHHQLYHQQGLSKYGVPQKLWVSH